MNAWMWRCVAAGLVMTAGMVGCVGESDETDDEGGDVPLIQVDRRTMKDDVPPPPPSSSTTPRDPATGMPIGHR